MTLKEFREATWDMPEQALIYIERPTDETVKELSMLIREDCFYPEIKYQYIHANHITKNEDENKILLSYFD